MANTISTVTVAASPATKKPSGVTITRNGNKLAIKWKISDANYGAGQQLQWKVRGTDWTNVTTGVATTAKTITFPASNFYPNAGKPVSERVYFRLRGRRSKYTDKKGNEFTPTWSDWTEAEFDWSIPNRPSLTATLDENLSNVTTFAWSTSTSTTDHKHFTNVEYQTVLVKNCQYTDGSKAPWKSSALGWATGTGAASGSQTVTENSTLLAADSYTRWFRVRSRGCRGASSYPDEKNWTYAKHVYARPYQANVTKVTAKTTAAGGFQCTVTWTAAANVAHPIDKVTVQYAIETPLAGMACPSGASWTDASVQRDTSDTDAASFSIDDVLTVDECLFIRVNTEHDTNVTYGLPTLASVGYLAAPTGLSVSPAGTNFTVSATNASSVPGSFLAVTYRGASQPNKSFVCGIIPNGSSSVTVSVPSAATESAVTFGVQAVVGTYTAKTRADGGTGYELKKQMTSQGIVWDGGAVPSAPANVTAEPAEQEGSIRVGWSWSWSGATEAELSWSDHADAWESTDQPQTYTVTNLYAAQWNIAGLDAGKVWYIRVRLIDASGEDPTYGPYSDTVTVDLSSGPAIPALQVSEGLIVEGSPVTARWSYVSTDGTPQAYATVALLTYGDSDEEIYTPIAQVETEQHYTIDTAAEGWTAGSEYLLVVQTTSRSGADSEWSDPVAVTVATPLTATISSSSLSTITITDDVGESHTVTALTAMPLTVTVTGAGAGGQTTVAIERAASYYVDRPDETTFTGHEGETVALVSQTGEAQMSITADDLIGPLDDGAAYNLIATVQDGLGQTASVTVYFEAHWSHQAIIPDATVVIDTDNNVAKITPDVPVGTVAGDTFDIYRLSADKPELIVEGGDWDTTYVDPYPALGRFGGHRFVFRSKDGDYITQDETFAWVDLGEDEGDFLDPHYGLIDFDGYQIPVFLDVDVSNDWEKDFQETRYLGGSVQGDWNAAVGRTGTVSGVVVVSEEPETIRKLRRLARWAGICHVRTLDGSSYAADVQVSETYSVDRGHKTSEFSLSITRVDPERPDGLTLAQWEAGNESE